MNTLQALIANAGRAALLCVAFGLAMYLLERTSGADTRQYRSRRFAHDIFYWVVNGSGLFQVAGGVVLLTAILRAFPQAQLHPLDDLPAWLRYAIHLMAFDFLIYWVHRLQHANPILWAFHATHHTQEELSFATTARSHPVEQWFIGLVVFVPIALLLGAPPLAWPPLLLAQQFLFALTHSRLDWNFGPLYRAVVSPTFHSVHHSLDPKHHDRNFAAIFSAWDYLFGTAVEERRRVQACGLNQIRMPTLWSSLVEPFRLAARARERGRLH